MSFKIRLNNISVPSGNQFKVFYKLNSRTPGNVTYQGDIDWGTLYGTYTGGTTTNIEIDFDLIDSNPFGKQYWFKILDTITGSYIIENIHIHEYEYYHYCDHCCDFGGFTTFGGYNTTITPTTEPTSTPTNTPEPTSTPTNTPEPTSTPTNTPTSTPTSTPTNTPEPTSTNTPTPTPTPNCEFDVDITTPTPEPTSTNTPTPTPTPNCEFDVDITTPTPEPTSTNTPTPTPTATSTPTPTSTGVVIEAQAYASMEPCIGGTIDDYMGASVTLDIPVTVDTNFDVTVWYKDLGNNCNFPNITTGAYSISFTVMVQAGDSYGDVDACTQGQNFTNGANICGACITGSDNTIDTITFTNPGGC